MLSPMKIMKILIVEDNAPMRRMIRSLVESFADEVFDCVDGEQAIFEYKNLQPDWVLMDINLGKMDGIAATRNICTEFPNAKIMIVTNFDDQSYRQSAKEAGAVKYLVKDDLYLLRKMLFSEQ